MTKRSNFRICWTEGICTPHEINVKPGWEEQEVSLLVDQINSGAFSLENDSAIDLSKGALDENNP